MEELGRDLALQVLASAYSTACVTLYALALLRLRAAPPRSAGPARARACLLRAVCITMTAALCFGEPWIYATRTQPASIGIASLCMMTAWSMLGLLLVPRMQLPASVGAVFWACFMHTMYGCREVRARRQRPREPRNGPHGAVADKAFADSSLHGAAAGAAAAAAAAATAAACTGYAAATDGAAAASKVVHVSAYTASEPSTDTHRPAACADAHAHGAAEGGKCSEAAVALRAGEGSEHLPAMQQLPLLPMVWTLCRLVITYDLGFALLCCTSFAGGCMCSGRPLGDLLVPDAAHGTRWLAAAVGAAPARLHALAAPFAWLLRASTASYYAWCLAAGALLALQLGILYALTRLALAVASRVALHMAEPAELPAADAADVAATAAAVTEAHRAVGVGLATLVQELPAEAFDSPLAASSISELWASRWHQFLRFHFQAGIGHKLVAAAARPAIWWLLPAHARRAALSVASTAAAFLMSGLLHEYLTWAAWGVVSWRYIAFFGAHGLAVISEGLTAQLLLPALAAWRRPRLGGGGSVAAAGAGRRGAGAQGPPMWLRRVYVVGFMAMASPFFVETYRARGYFGRCAWHPLLAPVSAGLLSQGGWCAAASCRA